MQVILTVLKAYAPSRSIYMFGVSYQGFVCSEQALGFLQSMRMGVGQISFFWNCKLRYKAGRSPT